MTLRFELLGHYVGRTFLTCNESGSRQCLVRAHDLDEKRIKLPVGLVIFQSDDFFINEGSIRVNWIDIPDCWRLVAVTRQDVGANIDRMIWMPAAILNSIVVGILISAVGGVDPSYPHEVSLIVQRHLVNQLQIRIEDLIGMQIAVFQGNVSRQPGVHILDNHEIRHIRRREADDRIIGRQCPRCWSTGCGCHVWLV